MEENKNTDAWYTRGAKAVKDHIPEIVGQSAVNAAATLNPATSLINGAVNLFNGYGKSAVDGGLVGVGQQVKQDAAVVGNAAKQAGNVIMHGKNAKNPAEASVMANHSLPAENHKLAKDVLMKFNSLVTPMMDDITEGGTNFQTMPGVNGGQVAVRDGDADALLSATNTPETESFKMPNAVRKFDPSARSLADVINSIPSATARSYATQNPDALRGAAARWQSGNATMKDMWILGQRTTNGASDDFGTVDTETGAVRLGRSGAAGEKITKTRKRTAGESLRNHNNDRKKAIQLDNMQTKQNNIEATKIAQEREGQVMGAQNDWYGQQQQAYLAEAEAIRSSDMKPKQQQTALAELDALMMKNTNEWKKSLGEGGSAGLQYTPGMIRNGYRLKGGDPAKKENWEKVG